jgi:tetratricopeptide (TPR) repeat protein
LQTTDEMAELWFQVLTRTADDRKTLGIDFSGHLAQLTIDYNEFLLKENPNDFEAHTRVGRAQLLLRKFPEAVAHLQAAVQANPKYDRAWYELGYFYFGLDRLSEAQQAFENVVRLNPDDYQAEGTLGAIFLKRGDLGRAESHLKAALRINPQDAVARRNLEIVMNAKAGAYNRR